MNRLVVNADLGRTVIHKDVYGHFAEHLGRCIYEGVWVGEDSEIPNVGGIRTDVVEALKRVKVPVLRWPGGCFADDYHWMDGIGPRDARPRRINTHWGGVIETNHFGTHEFFELCELIGAEPYICGNVGSGSVREMRDWIEYITFDGDSSLAELRRENGRESPWRLPYFGVGNENWGCGGHMRPEHYADLYRRYQTYVRSLSGNKIYKIACGANGSDYRWTEVLMREAGRFMHGLSLHYYTRMDGRGSLGSATDFEADEWFEVMRRSLVMETLIKRHGAIMDQYDPARRIGMIVDEWGTWYEVEPGTNPGFLYQQNTIRDALVAGVHLNIFNNHADRVRMANLAQTVNVLQALILTDGPRMILTPTYHVFEMYKEHQGATLLPSSLDCEPYEFEGEAIPSLSASASLGADGKITVTLCNLNHEDDASLKCELRGASVVEASGRVLTADRITEHNTFDAPERVRPIHLEEVRIDSDGFTVVLPPRSVAVVTATV